MSGRPVPGVNRLGAFLLACVLGCALPAVARADLRSTDFMLARDLDVKVLHGYPVTRHGYFGPVAFGIELRNRGGERSVQIDITRPTRASRSLRVPAGERVRAFFALPVRTSYGSAATVQITDSASGRRREVIAESEYTTEEPLARLGPITTALNVEKPWTLIGSLDGRLPDDWRALSGVRVIVVEHAYAATHVSDWRTLIDWVAMGGVLLVSTPGASMADPVPWPGVLPFARTVRETQAGLVQQVGYGAIARVWPERLATIGSSLLDDIGVCASCGWSVPEHELEQDIPHKAAHNRLRPYVAEPGWGLFFVLLLFATAVGPVGWIWLVKRRGAPLVYLAFVIANATVFSGAVLGHDLFENGITAKCVARSLVLIDQRSDSEIGIEDAALYAPTASGTRLRLPAAGMALLPATVTGLEEEMMQVELADGRQLISGGVPVRRRELAAVRWLQPQRGGLEIEDAGGQLWVENQTGYDLRALLIWRGKALYRVPQLAQGARARPELVPADQMEANAPALASESVVGNAAPLARAIIDGELGENRYFAVYAWSPARSSLVNERVNAVSSGTQLLAGVF